MCNKQNGSSENGNKRQCQRGKKVAEKQANFDAMGDAFNAFADGVNSMFTGGQKRSGRATFPFESCYTSAPFFSETTTKVTKTEEQPKKEVPCKKDKKPASVNTNEFMCTSDGHTGDHYVVNGVNGEHTYTFALPGVSKANVNARIEESKDAPGKYCIRVEAKHIPAECSTKSLYDMLGNRSFDITVLLNYVHDTVEAEFKNGMLAIKVTEKIETPKDKAFLIKF